MSSKPVVIRGKLKLKGSTSSSGGGNHSKKLSNSSISRESSNQSSLLDDEKNTSSTSNAINGDSIVNIKRNEEPSSTNSNLTESQRKFHKRKHELELQTIKKLSNTTYRDRVESFNQKLSVMTGDYQILQLSFL